MRYIIGPCQLSILNIAVRTCPSRLVFLKAHLWKEMSIHMRQASGVLAVFIDVGTG